MKKKIPERIEIICDSCNFDMTNSHNKHSAKIIINADALDYSGAAVASANRGYDFCDDCYMRFLKTLKTDYNLK